MKKPSLLLMITVFFFIGTVCFAQDQSLADYSWVNGKWQGLDWEGGMLVLELQIVNGNQIKGTGRSRGTGKKIGVSTIISGTVDGSKVELDSYAQGNKVTTKYLFALVDGALVGKGFDPRVSTESFETKFRKLD